MTKPSEIFEGKNSSLRRTFENTMKPKPKKEIRRVCSPCGISANVLTCLKKYGRSPKKLAFDVSTSRKGICDVCGDKKTVTSVRDFFYPDFDLLIKKYK